MPYKVAKSDIVEKKLKLSDRDGDEIPFEEHELVAKIRQARQGDVQRLHQKGPRYQRRYDDDGRAITSTDFDFEDFKKEAVLATLAGINLVYEDGEEVFQFKKNRVLEKDPNGGDYTFDEAWGNLEPEIAEAIAVAVFEVNPLLLPTR